MVLLFIDGHNNRWGLTLRDTVSGKVLTEYGNYKGSDETLHHLAIHIGCRLLKKPVPLTIIGRLPINVPDYHYQIADTPEMRILSYLCF